MSWHSGVMCGNQGLKRGRAAAEGCCDRVPGSEGGPASMLCAQNPRLQGSWRGPHHASRTPTQFPKGATQPGNKPGPRRRWEDPQPGEQMAWGEAIWNDSEVWESTWRPGERRRGLGMATDDSVVGEEQLGEAREMEVMYLCRRVAG